MPGKTITIKVHVPSAGSHHKKKRAKGKKKKKGHHKQTRKQRAASLKNLKKARAAQGF